MATPARKAAPAAADDGGDTWENRITAIPPAPAPADDPEELAELELGDRLRVAFAQAPGDRTRVALYRRDPLTKARQWCADYTADQFEDGGLDLIRRDWGSGVYEVRAFGSRGLLTRATFEIATPPPKPEAGGDALARVLQSLADSQAAILARLSNPAPAPAPADPMAEMQRMLALASGMREAFGMGAAPPPVQSPTSVLGELMGAMKSLKELSREVNPPAEGDPDNPLSMIGPIVSLIRDGMAARRGESEPLPIIQTPPGFQAPAPATAPDQVAPIPGDDMKALVMKGIADKFIAMATANESAEKGGAFIYQALPDEFLPFLTLPNWFDLLANAMPSVKPHRAWIEAAKLEADKLFAADSPT